MNLTNFYRQILGITSSWQIQEVAIDKTDKSVHIHLSHNTSTQFPCKHCKTLCSVHDHGKTRKWRHLDTCDHYTYLHAALPRTACPACGVCTIEPEWSRAGSRFTLQFEGLMIDTLQSTQVRSRTALQLRVTEDQLKRVQKQAVERGLAHRKVNTSYIVHHVCIDEKSLFTGHHYVTLLYDGSTGTVLEVVEHRTYESAQRAFQELGKYIDLQQVKVVTMDMWRAFKNAAKMVIPHADIVHDRFHLSQYLNKAVDITRRAENKKLMANKDERLKGSKYLWLKNPDTFTPIQQQTHEKLSKDSTLKTVQAWKIKEHFKDFFTAKTIQKANDFFNDWYEQVQQSENKALLKVAKTFEKHLGNIVTYAKHQLTNAVAECINTAIQQVKSKARGFKSAKAFRIAILFHLGNLNLYP